MWQYVGHLEVLITIPLDGILIGIKYFLVGPGVLGCPTSRKIMCIVYPCYDTPMSISLEAPTSQ